MTDYLLCIQSNKVFQGDCFEKSRKRENVNARMAVCVILNEKKFYTLQKIASLFNLNHEMVLYYQKKHNDLIKFNREYRILFNTLKNIIEDKGIIKHGFCHQITFSINRISKSHTV